MILFMAKPNEKHRGIVKCYLTLREYGFISREKGRDVFFIRSDFECESQITEGAEVEFELENATKEPRARKIKRLS